MAKHTPRVGSETTMTISREWGMSGTRSLAERISDLVDSAKTAREFYGKRGLSPDAAVTYYADQATELFKNRHK